MKENAVEVLNRQLPSLTRGVEATGGVCDSYQSVERGRGLPDRSCRPLAGTASQ